jgi:hypothetical protein
MTTTAEMTTYAPYLPPISSPYHNTLPSLAQPVKSEYYAEEDIATNPFASGYQLMGGNTMEIPPPHAYPESDAHVKLPPRKSFHYAH